MTPYIQAEVPFPVMLAKKSIFSTIGGSRGSLKPDFRQRIYIDFRQRWQKMADFCRFLLGGSLAEVRRRLPPPYPPHAGAGAWYAPPASQIPRKQLN